MVKLFEIRRSGRNHRKIHIFGIKLLSYCTSKYIDFNDGVIDYTQLSVQSCPTEEKKNTAADISLIYPVYFQNDDHKKFNDQITRYDTEYPDELKQRVNFIIIDDGSKYPVSLPECNLNITLLRVDKDIPWNNSGARNLGACYAQTPKLLMNDLDWFIPEETMKFCLNAKLEDKDMLVFDYIRPNGRRVHPNIFALNKNTYMNFNGYDEYYCGFYGEDIPFRKRLNSIGINFIRTGNNIELTETKPEHFLSRDLSKLEDAMLKSPSVDKINKPMIDFPWHFVDAKHYI